MTIDIKGHIVLNDVDVCGGLLVVQLHAGHGTLHAEAGTSGAEIHSNDSPCVMAAGTLSQLRALFATELNSVVDYVYGLDTPPTVALAITVTDEAQTIVWQDTINIMTGERTAVADTSLPLISEDVAKIGIIESTDDYRVDDQPKHRSTRATDEASGARPSVSLGKVKPVLSRLLRLPPLFWLTVAVPTACAVLYYEVLASDVYISESRFVVRSPDKPAVSGLGLLVKSSGLSTSGDEIYATKDYLTSRDALRAINRNNAFQRAFTKPSDSIFDRFNGSGHDGSFEALYKYYDKRVKVEYDTSSSITTLSTQAFDARDAQRFNEQLLEMAEETVNRMSERGRRDLISLAENEVIRAKEKAKDAAAALARYRDQEGVIDPEKQAAVQMQMISKLQDGVITTKTQLLELRTLAPQNPQIPVLETRAKGLEREIARQLGAVAGSQGSLAASAVEYQRLAIENQFAEKQLASAMASFEEARSEARRKHAYVERVVQPNLPDYPIEPRRLRGIFSVFALGLILWGVLSLLLAGLLEHRD